MCPKSPKDEETGAKSKKTPNDQDQEERSDTWLCAVDGTTKAEEICPDSKTGTDRNNGSSMKELEVSFLFGCKLVVN